MAQEVTTENSDEALYLTYKARIYPNSEQRRAIAADIENSRYVHDLMITYCRPHLDGYGRLSSRNDLGTRVHSCPGCGLVMDRDVNAAINILIRLRNTDRPFSRP